MQCYRSVKACQHEAGDMSSNITSLLFPLSLSLYIYIFIDTYMFSMRSLTFSVTWQVLSERIVSASKMLVCEALIY